MRLICGNEKSGRYNIIDMLRGFALLNMIIYHAVWDAVYMFGADWDWYRSAGAYIWQQWICWTFIFISGFCAPLSGNLLKRGAAVFAAGLIITAVTLIAVPSGRVIFGVLTLIGSCMLIFSALRGALRRTEPVSCAAAAFAVFFVTRGVNDGYLGFEGMVLAELPQEIYANIFTAYLGFPPAGFYSSDYFSLVPWIFLFACGYFSYLALERHGLTGVLKTNRTLPFERIGRMSLIIYMIHQPVIYIVLSAAFGLMRA